MAKLWGGRFEKETDPLVDRFQASLPFDRRLFRHDIRGSRAHALMLARVGLLTEDEAAAIVEGLAAVEEDIAAGRAEDHPEDEDIHTQIERLLYAKVGPLAGKLHTGRSRNDQVATALRLYLKEEMAAVADLLRALIGTLLDLAEEHAATVMPGYTHLQRAQPVTLGHHLVAYACMFRRDLDRLADCYRRTDVLPLGSGALAGTTLPLDREFVARELGFGAVSPNSLDAVADRDFCVEFLGAAALIMVHLSRLSEEIVLWSTAEFGFVEPDDAFATGSSMMPQKKNPDVAELIRAKTGRVCGDLQALLMVLKGLPLAYNRDLQEDKEALFDALDTVKACLAVCRPMLATMRVRTGRLSEAAGDPWLLATDLADYLVGKGLPFREAHRVVGELVRFCLERGRDPGGLSLEEYRRFSPLFGGDVYRVWDARSSVEARRLTGGPAPERVRAEIARLRAELADFTLTRSEP
ncbi:MAG: argininosuccinate lyase [Firmicutes bacterium]|nr:argininosuccinate lyase [Bacillota bacterium]